MYVCVCVRTYEAGVSHTDAAYVHGLQAVLTAEPSLGRIIYVHTYIHAVCTYVRSLSLTLSVVAESIARRRSLVHVARRAGSAAR